MARIPIRGDDGKDGGRVFAYRGQPIMLKSGRLTVLRSMSPQRRARVRQYLLGNLPGPDSPVWSVVASKVAADLGMILDGGSGNE
jgi:hypothetical protein